MKQKPMGNQKTQAGAGRAKETTTEEQRAKAIRQKMTDTKRTRTLMTGGAGVD